MGASGMDGLKEVGRPPGDDQPGAKASSFRCQTMTDGFTVLKMVMNGH
jgi:hypothetical protein